MSFHPRRCTDREGYKPERAADVVQTTHDPIVLLYVRESRVCGKLRFFFFLFHGAPGSFTPCDRGDYAAPRVYEPFAIFAISFLSASVSVSFPMPLRENSSLLTTLPLHSPVSGQMVIFRKLVNNFNN